MRDIEINNEHGQILEISYNSIQHITMVIFLLIVELG